MIQKILSRYFWKSTSRILSIYYWFRGKKSEAVFVLTPGKVGSSSIYKSLKHSLTNHDVFHFHFLSEKMIEEGIAYHRHSVERLIPFHFTTSKIVRKYYLNEMNKLTVITLFRNPAERFISDFFQNLERNLAKDKLNDVKFITEQIYLSLSNNEHLNYIEDWIQSELIQELGIDFYNLVEINSNGYYIHKIGNITFVVMLMEKNECFF